MKLAGTVLFEPCLRSQLELTQMTDETSSRTEMAFLIFFFYFFGWGKEKMFSSCVEIEFKSQSLPHFTQTTGFFG